MNKAILTTVTGTAAGLTTVLCLTYLARNIEILWGILVCFSILYTLFGAIGIFLDVAMARGSYIAQESHSGLFYFIKGILNPGLWFRNLLS